MVTSSFQSIKRNRQRGLLLTELMVALAILALVLIPMSFSFMDDHKLCRIYYFQAVAMEIVDGEMEVLRAGQWRLCQEGTHPYQVRAQAAKSLPAGSFTTTRTGSRLVLKWVPAQKQRGGVIAREMEIK